jgi:chlorite dismutase
LIGEPLPEAPRLNIYSAQESIPAVGHNWLLRGIRSNERYVTRAERSQLVAVQDGLGRPESTCAALIPIRKSAAWWSLTQDERRAIFEEQSHHIKVGLKHLPPVARRLHHCRDLCEQEPFDFLTWFEYAPAYEAAFDALLQELRTSAEWQYVDREIDLRLVRREV